MILLEDKALSLLLCSFLPSHLLAIGRICHLFIKGAPKGTGACWQLEAFLGSDGSWAVKKSVAVLVFTLPYTASLAKDCLRWVKAEDCDVLASELKRRQLLPLSAYCVSLNERPAVQGISPVAETT